jgi:hypothetical protein
MLRLFRACGVNDDDIAHVERDIALWGRGSVWFDADEAGQKLLRITSPAGAKGSRRKLLRIPRRITRTLCTSCM